MEVLIILTMVLTLCFKKKLGYFQIFIQKTKNCFTYRHFTFIEKGMKVFVSFRGSLQAIYFLVARLTKCCANWGLLMSKEAKAQ